MTNKNTVVEGNVVLTGDISDVSAKIEETKGNISSIGDAAESSGTRVTSAFGKASGAVSKMAGAATAVQAAFSTLIIPVLFVTGITALADKISQMKKDSEDLKDSLNAAGESLKSQLTSDIRSDALTQLQQEILGIQDAANQAEEAIVKVFEDRSDAISISWRAIKQELEAATGIDFGFSSDELFENTEEAIRRLRENVNDLTNEATERNRQRIEDAVDLFNSSAQGFSQEIAKQQIQALREAGDFVGAAALELEIQSQVAASQRLKMIKDIQEATKELGDEFDEAGKKMLANFDQLSKAQEESIRRNAKILQEQYLQPFINSLDTAFGSSSFTTRLDTISAQLAELTSVAGRR